MNISSYNRKVVNKKCKKCGGTLYANTSLVLTSYPPLYNCKCEKCGNIENYNCNDLSFDWSLPHESTTQYIGSLGTGTTCNHNFDMKLINGCYISYCTRCGKIGDSKTAINTVTCSVTGTLLGNSVTGVYKNDK